MYRPKAFQEEDREKLIGFMRANSFATLVSIVDGVPFASHIPLVVSVSGDEIKLMGHLAQQNPHSQACEAVESLAIFTGPHAYISPTLYENHQSVPTWNYMAVHAYGCPKFMTVDRAIAAMDNLINTMIQTYEASYQSHWKGLSHGYRDGMMQGIVGVEMVVTRLEGKYKLSQNRSLVDQSNVSQTLLHSSDPAK